MLTQADRAVLVRPATRGNTAIFKAIVNLLQQHFSFLCGQSIDLCASHTEKFKSAEQLTCQTLYTGNEHFIEVSTFDGRIVVFDSLRTQRELSKQTPLTQQHLLQLFQTVHQTNSTISLWFADAFRQSGNFECMWFCILVKTLICQQYAASHVVDYKVICSVKPDFAALKSWILACLEGNRIISEVPVQRHKRAYEAERLQVMDVSSASVDIGTRIETPLKSPGMYIISSSSSIH